MTIKEAKDKAAQESGFKNWADVLYLSNENGINRMADKAMILLLAHYNIDIDRTGCKQKCSWIAGGGCMMCSTCGMHE